MYKKLKLLFPLLLLWSGFSQAINENDLLPPEQAFALQAAELDGDQVNLTWKIADGYYLYENKLKATAAVDGVLGSAELPKAKRKNDPIFGDVGIYRQSVTMTLPVTNAAAAGDGLLDIQTNSQGCADLGVCYPPQRKTVQVDLASLQTSALPASEPAGLLGGLGIGDKGNSALGRLSNLSNDLGFGNDEDELLPPDEAFKFIPTVLDGNTLRLSWEVAPEYYMYRDKIKLAVKGPADIQLMPYELPKGKLKEDPSFGTVQVYYGLVPVDIKLQRGSAADATLELQANYQGCAERGVCYPPINKTISLPLGAAVAVQTEASTNANTSLAPETDGTASSVSQVSAAEPVSEQDELAKFLVEKPLWVALGVFFLLGLGLAFTPCVFPMIPILSGIIIGQGKELTTRKALTLSAIYVLAMAVTYTLVGVFAALGGANLQIWFQDPVILSIFAAIFVLLALSMFGFYELQMPASIQAKLANLSNKQQGGTFIGVAIMGFLSALIVGPCITAPLIGAMIVIGQTGDPVLGGSALFALSMGMGAPLLVIGASAGKLLPRAGGWMDAVKGFFGVGLLAVALWLLERILPASLMLFLWGALIISSAVYMGAFDPIGEGKSGWAKFWKGLGVVLALYGALQIIGAASGSKNLWQPLKGFGAGASSSVGATSTSASQLPFEMVKGNDGLDMALEQAAAAGQPVMLDFYADWCVACKELEYYTFSDANVIRNMKEFRVLKTDVTANDAADQALLKRFGLIGPPAILFFAPDKNERKGYRLVGFVPPEEFTAHVSKFKGSLK